MTMFWSVVVVVAPALTLLGIVFLLDRSRRSPSAALDKSFRRHARNCSRSLHEWETPWQKGALVRIYAEGTWKSEAAERMPVEQVRTYTTQCRHCGVPRSKQVNQ